MPRIYFYALLILMLACGAAVSLGELDPNVSLDSAREIWSDVLRDVDQFGLHATRVSADKEMQLGAEIAEHIKTWGSEDPDASKYVAAVAAELLPHVNRPAIRYRIHVIQSPEVNAFAVPGGHIYVLTGLLDFLESEAELASVLGHEISHVDLRHCIERYQYELALKKVGAGDVGVVVGLAHQFASLGYAQYQELEADASGERMAIEAGYDPDAATAVFQRMKAKFGEKSSAPATTPAGEVGQAVGSALGAYLQTHPPSEERARQLNAMVARNHSTLAGRIFYRGVNNLKDRVPRSVRRVPSESRVF
jgi:beta-barrel assembly-enhancing protease